MYDFYRHNRRSDITGLAKRSPIGQSILSSAATAYGGTPATADAAAPGSAADMASATRPPSGRPRIAMRGRAASPSAFFWPADKHRNPRDGGMIHERLLDILVCPETRSGLRLADEALLQMINAAIQQGVLTNRCGEPVEKPLDAALIREDNALAYPVVDDIPIMLVDEAIPLDSLRNTSEA